MREKRPAQPCSEGSSEAGTVIPFVALGMTVLLLCLALALDQGMRYAGRTQLQELVDAASQAALIALSAPGGDRAAAESAARNVAANTGVMQGFTPTDLQVQFGRFDFNTSTFSPEALPVGPAQAVRIYAAKTGEKAFRSLMTGAPITADADSVAALRCLNVVFVQDVSSSFVDDIDKVQTALRSVVADLGRSDFGGESGTRVGLVAFRNIVAPEGTTSKLVSPGDSRIRDAIDALDDASVACTGDIVTQGSTTLIPSCVGSNLRAGLEYAEDLLQPGNGKNATCEDFVLAISDGVPCRILEQDLRRFGNVRFAPAPAGEPQGGGSTEAETLSYVNSEMRASGGSIAVLTMNSDPVNGRDRNAPLKSCPTTPKGASDQDGMINTEFAQSLISGFGQAFESNANAEQMANQMSAALASLPPVTVR